MHHIQLVTGKGGVGKSFVAALLARKMAREGAKTLLIEMGPWSYLERALALEPRKSLFTPRPTPYGFDHAVWAGEDCLTDYVKYLVKVPWVSEAFLQNAWLKSLIKIAPGLREISFLGKLTSQVRKHGPPMNYDTLVVDAVSSGHFVALMKTAPGLMEVTRMGPLRDQSQAILDVLNNPSLVKTRIVSNLENFSVQETEELMLQIRPLVKSPVVCVANRIYPVPEENPSQNSTPEALQFIQHQIELRDFQKRQMAALASQCTTLERVPFAFQTLKEILENDDSRIFEHL